MHALAACHAYIVQLHARMHKSSYMCTLVGVSSIISFFLCCFGCLYMLGFINGVLYAGRTRVLALKTRSCVFQCHSGQQGFVAG